MYDHLTKPNKRNKSYYKKVFKLLIEEEGYILLSEYKNSRDKVKIKCPNGHIIEVRPGNFKNRGSRCPKCSNKCNDQAKEHFYELIQKDGYTLLSEYKNNRDKVKIKCPNGHEWNVKPNSFKNNIRCPKCSGNCSDQAKDGFIQLIKKEEYTIHSEYKNSKTKVFLKCPNGHEWNVKPNSFKSGQRCPVCSGNCTKHAKTKFIELLKKEGYTLLSEYKDNKTKVDLECPNGHIFKVRPDNFKGNYCRCPHCKGSTGQRLLQSMLEENIDYKMIYNDRSVLNGLELDIYFPDLDIAIEYQGNYWHNLPENKKRDERKKQICKDKDIKLIEIWDKDFIKNEKFIVKSIIQKLKGG